MKLMKKIKINWLESDKDINIKEGFISVYNNGILYINVDLASNLDDDIKWVKVGVDENKNIIIIRPSKTPINAYPVEKVFNAKIVKGVPTYKLRLNKKRAKTYQFGKSFIVSLI
jgi:hypothetical protein